MEKHLDLREKSPHLPVIPRWGTSAGLWRRSMAWPDVPTTLATTPQLSSPPRESSTRPQSSTSQVGTPPSTEAWEVGRPFALPSITPSGSMVRRHSPSGGVPLVLTHQPSLTPTNPPSYPSSQGLTVASSRSPEWGKCWPKKMDCG